MHQAEVSLLDEVEQRESGRLVLLGDRDDEPEVRLDEGPLRLIAVPNRPTIFAPLGGGHVVAGLVHLGPGRDTALDLLGEPYLALLGQQGVLADIGEIQPDEVFLVPFDPILRQSPPPPLSEGPLAVTPSIASPGR